MVERQMQSMDFEQVVKSPTFWADVISGGYTRRIPRGLLMNFCNNDFRESLLQKIIDGDYFVSPPHEAYIPKDDGKMRKVYVNTDQDRMVLRAINTLYANYRDGAIHPKCLAYRRGISKGKIAQQVIQEIKKLENSSEIYYGFKVDISKYFDSVPIEVIESLLVALKAYEPFDKILWDYYHDNRILVDGVEVEHYKSLAQGCALSSFLSNLILVNIDKAMDSLCPLFYRYCDDMLFFCKEPERIFPELVNMLSAIGLELNPKKIEPLGSDFVFLGMHFLKDGTVGIGPRSERKFFDTIDNLTKFRLENKYNEKALRSTIARVNMWLYGAKHDLESPQGTRSWADTYFQYATSKQDVIRLDRYVKDSIRRSYTERMNYTHNRNKLPDEKLKELGYASMVHMWSAYRTNPALFKTERLQIG